jgi:hypothetical protein
MIEATRRSFLVGLFGSMAVAAAGPIPKAILDLSEHDFKEAIKLVSPPNPAEIYSNGKDYAFATIKYLNGAPWFEITIPTAFRPMREESDRISAVAIAKMKAEYGQT